MKSRDLRSQRSSCVTLLTALVLLCAFLLPTAAFSATTTFVDPARLCAGNTPCLTTIQEGVNAAGGGASTVFVFPGTYAESVDVSLIGSAPGSGGAADIALVAVDASGAPAVGLASVEPIAGEAFFNSLQPFAFSVEIRGFLVTSATTDAIDIEGCAGTITVADVTADGAVYDGIDVRADGDITLARVTSQNNGNDGFQIEIEGEGNLSITDCAALDNGPTIGSGSDDDGFQIYVLEGSVDILGSRAERNQGSGFEIRSLPGGGIPSVRIAESVAIFNANDGFQIEDSCDPSPQGPECGGVFNIPITNVTILDTIATDNDVDGIEVNALWTEESSAPVPRIEVRRVDASRNGANGGSGDGFDIQTGDPTVTPVDLESADAIFEDITAIGNNGDGLQLEGRDGEPLQLRDVTLRRVLAEDNGNDGIEVEGAGTLEAEDIQVRRNGFTGSSDGMRDGFEANNGDGDFDFSTVTLRRIVAEGNAGEGIDLDVAVRAELSDIVAVGNGFNDDEEPKDGLQIDQGELFVPVPPPPTLLGAVELDVVLTRCDLSGNSKDGLNADNTRGSITIQDCDFVFNEEDGLDVDGSTDSGINPSSLQITRVSAVSNADDGLDLSSRGTITLDSPCALDNSEDGILVKGHQGLLSVTGGAAAGNRYGLGLTNTSVQPVTVSGSDFSGNTIGGAVNELAGVSANASGNFWGAASGPTHPNNAGGTGDSVLDMFSGGLGTIDFSGFSSTPFQGTPCPQRYIAATDLSITKNDNVTIANPGASVTYAIVAANSGPGDVFGVDVVDNFPAVLSCSWVSTPSGGATGNTSGSGPGLADTLDLPAGSSVTYIANCMIDSGATGTLSNTATITTVAMDTNPSNNSATDDDTVLAPFADLSLVKFDGETTAAPGETLTYRISISNTGPSDAPGSVLTDVFPPEFTAVTWTCAADAGSSCPASGSGDINATFDLERGDQARFEATGTVAPGFVGVLSNTATVAVAGGVTDPNSDNDSDTDTTTIASAAILSGTKSVAGTFVPGGLVTYTIVITNEASETQFDDPLNDEFIDILPPGLEIVDATADSGLIATAGNVVTWNGSLAGGASVTLTIDARILPDAAGTTLVNQGEIFFDSDGDGVNDTRVPTDNPDLPGSDDPTAIEVASIAEIPTLGGRGLALLLLLLGLSAWWALRRR
ncbi:MAG: right-handed parallel beta-helix repeat-containing protein [Acidobacteriota bacterium]